MTPGRQPHIAHSDLFGLDNKVVEPYQEVNLVVYTGVVPESTPLARLLTAATQLAAQRLNETLAGHGYPNLRPAHGYAALAVGADGATTSQLGARLGITKQAAAKLASQLERDGYLRRVDHPRDGRAQLLLRTARGDALLRAAAEVQEQIERDWAQAVGEPKIRAMRSALESVLDHAPEDRPLRRVW
jgi:DNA-binding MarR family transcriptional regulator